MEGLVGVPRHVDVPFAQGAGRRPQGEDALLPVGMENRFIPFSADRAEAHHSTKVLRAIHQGASADSD